MKKLHTLVLGILLITNAYSQSSILSIQISPTQPTTNDTVLVFANLAFPSSDCLLDGAYHSIVGNTIMASAHHCLGMAAAICYATDTFVIAPLAAGNYTFDLELTSGYGGPPCSPGIVPDDTLNFSFTVSAAQPPCTLTGASVYVDHASAPWMMNATVNGISNYSYAWTDTSGTIVSTANQTPFYTQWCVTITDIISGCDTTICQDCIADTNAICMCTMIYMPVCGCDGVMYANSCVADCAGVPWTPAIPNGMPGGFLPCPQPNTCEVEISGDSILCTWGSPIVLQASPSATSSNFVSYYWANGQSNNSVLTITTPGTYCVVATDSSGCVDSACFTVAMNEVDIYSAPNPAVICKGDSIVLEIDPTYSNIIWSTGDTTDRIVVYPLTQTTYVVEAIDTNGCDARGELTVDVLYPPFLFIYSVPNPPNICLGDSIVLEASAGFVNYYWFNGMTGDRIVDFPTQDSWYMVEAVDSNGCVVKEDIWVYVDSCNTSVNELFNNQLKIYPNPTSDKVNIELPKGIVANISLTDLQGRILHQRKNVFEYHIFNTKDLAKGTYLIKIESTEGGYSRKLLIE